MVNEAVTAYALLRKKIYECRITNNEIKRMNWSCEFAVVFVYLCIIYFFTTTSPKPAIELHKM